MGYLILDALLRSMIRFMMKEAENMMKGSVHEDDFFIVHDDLVLMTAKEMIKWMKEKNYYHRWLLPMNDCRTGHLMLDAM